MNDYRVDERGYYGAFGGAYVPEILRRAVEELQRRYVPILESAEFRRDYDRLLRDYVGRPSPLYLAGRLSQKYGCRIYLKRGGSNHTGRTRSTTPWRDIRRPPDGQAAYHRRDGSGTARCGHGDGLCADGNALRGVYGQDRRGAAAGDVERMRMLGAEVRPVTSGNMTLKDATNEAIRDWCTHPEDTYYIIGSTVGPHPYPDMVARLQSVISEEIRRQLSECEGRPSPDYLIACVGGGSNAAGTVYHFLDDPDVKILLAEAGGLGIDTPMSAATIHLGRKGIIHGAHTLLMQDEDGQILEPYSLSAGLDYPGIGPLHAHLFTERRAEVLAVNDDEALRAAYELTRLEGIIPALEVGARMRSGCCPR